MLYVLSLKNETDKKFKNIQQRIEELKKENFKLIDDKVADAQFRSNNYYRKNEFLKPFFDSLDTSYKILRIYLQEEEYISTEDQIFLKEILLNNLPKIGGMNKEDVLTRMGIKRENEIFQGSKLEIAKRLMGGLSLNFMTGGRYSFNYYDIWRKETDLELLPGETTKIMIRLLRNYEFRSNHLEFIPSKRMKIIEPYLGELTVQVPNNLSGNKVYETRFELFDWINRDTITERILISLKKK